MLIPGGYYIFETGYISEISLFVLFKSVLAWLVDKYKRFCYKNY
jgi:hypothetical protein